MIPEARRATNLGLVLIISAQTCSLLGWRWASVVLGLLGAAFIVGGAWWDYRVWKARRRG